MKLDEAAVILGALVSDERLQAKEQEALQVVLASLEISPPEPAQAPTPTVDGLMGFVGLLVLPEFFWLEESTQEWRPYELYNAVLSWNRLLSFGGPGMGRPTPKETWLEHFVRDLLPGSWSILPITDETTVDLEQNHGTSMSFPARPDQLQTVDRDGSSHWDFQRGASSYDVLSVLAHAASAVDVFPEKTAGLGAGEAIEVPRRVYESGLSPRAQTVENIGEWQAWCTTLAMQIRSISGRCLLRRQPFADWAELTEDVQEMWVFWVRAHPGMLRLELALRDFFDAGGKQAHVVLSLEAEGSLPPLDDVELSAICAPGLGAHWQEAIAQWGAQQGVRAICESPFFSDRAPPAGIHLDPDGWTLTNAGYEAHPGVCDSADDVAPWRVVANPLSQGSYDQHRRAPPAGFLAVKGPR